VSQTRSEPTRASRRAASTRRGNPVARIARFFREVVAELAKVIWPSRSDLITYTIVVLVFVAVIIAIVAGLDVGFAKLVVWAFG
jgi:preprotein translocase subunit SecE